MEGMFKAHEDTVLLNLDGATTRRILAWNDRLMSVEVGFETGSIGVDHTHPHTQLSYVLAGRFRYTVDGKSVEMKPGDSIVVPSGAVHGTVCLEAGMLLDVFTPAREDFLK